MRVLFWVGWVLLIWAWADFGFGWLFGIDIWKEIFGLDGQGPIHFSPMIAGAFGIVCIAVGR